MLFNGAHRVPLAVISELLLQSSSSVRGPLPRWQLASKQVSKWWGQFLGREKGIMGWGGTRALLDGLDPVTVVHARFYLPFFFLPYPHG